MMSVNPEAKEAISCHKEAAEPSIYSECSGCNGYGAVGKAIERCVEQYNDVTREDVMRLIAVEQCEEPEEIYELPSECGASYGRLCFNPAVLALLERAPKPQETVQS